MKPLGINQGRYRGEHIDILENLRRIQEAGLKHGWDYRELEADAEIHLPVLSRTPARVERVFYVSTGMHGDEPAGPESLRKLMEENIWPENAQLFICPCLNPTGNLLHTRENRDGVDLNRDYHDPRSPEIRAHVEWLDDLPRMDMTLCLHEDWEAEGFYLYELNQAGCESRAESIVGAVEAVCPIDRSPEIEEWPASGGILRPQVDPDQRPEWPEAIYLSQRKTSLSYTLEAPSDFPLAVRVDALARGVRAAMAFEDG